MINFPKTDFLLACWDPDPHMRPSFENILIDLDSISHSKFRETPHESFHIMQDDWKVEIEEVLLGLKMKEKVRDTSFFILISKMSKLMINEVHRWWGGGA